MSKQKLRFAALIEQLGVVYQTEITDLLLRAYYEALKDVPLDDLERAVAAHIALQRWFPKPSELLSIDPKADAVRAWDSAIAAIHHHGMYRHVDFEDKYVNAVIRHLGGWPTFCAQEPEQESWTRKEFVQTYLLLRSSGLTDKQMDVLPGISEANVVVRSNGLIEQQHLVIRKIKSPKIVYHERIANVQQNEKARIGKN